MEKEEEEEEEISLIVGDKRRDGVSQLNEL